MNHLRSLSLCSVGRLKSLDGVQAMHNLQTLKLFGNGFLYNWKALSELPQLTALALTGIANYPFYLNTLEEMPLLRDANLSGCKKLSNSKTSLPNLQSLSLCGISTSYGPLVHLRYLLGDTEGLSNLQSLNLSNNDKLQRIEGLGPLPQLNSLRLAKCKVLKSVKGLNACAPSLSHLSLSGCQRLNNLSGLEGLKHLKTLDLTGCSKITDIENLKELKTLTALNLVKCKSLSDLSMLKELPELKELTLSKRGLSEDVVVELENALPELVINRV